MQRASSSKKRLTLSILAIAAVVTASILVFWHAKQSDVVAVSDTAVSVAAVSASAKRTDIPAQGPQMVLPGTNNTVSTHAEPKTVIAQYEHRKLCIDAKSGAALLEGQQHDPKSLLNDNSNYEGLTAETKAARLGQLKALQDLTDIVTRAKTECGDIDNKALSDGSIYPLALAAATLGDQDAAACYVTTGFPMPDSMRTNRAQFLAYKENALRLIDAGVRAGNWMLVSSARAVYSGRNSNNWLYSIAAADPVAVYRYTRLEQLGVRSPATQAMFARDVAVQAKELTPNQIKKENAWAEKTYRQYFRNGGYFDDDAGMRCG